MDARSLVSPHPGVLLREQMEYYDLGFPELAAAIDSDVRQIEELAAEQRPLTAALALKFATYFDMPAESWMGGQSAFDIARDARRLTGELECITPIDPARGRDFDDEPLPDDVMADIRERLHDVEDPTRYMIRSDLFGDSDADDHDAHFRLYFDISSGMWSSSICSATLFKRKEDAEQIAGRLGGHHRIVEFGPPEQRAYLDERAERGRHARFEEVLSLVRRASVRAWDPGRHLESTDDMLAYLEVAAATHDSELTRAAVEDVVRAAARLARAARKEL